MLRKENGKRKRVSSLFQPNKKAKLDTELKEVIVDVSQSPFTFFLHADHSQLPLLKKINAYLKQRDRPLFSEKGYCHGLAIVWLQKMAEGKAEWFYLVWDAIIAYPWSRIEEIEEQIEKFIAMIEWGQNINDYLSDVKTQDIARTLELNYVESKNFFDVKEKLSYFFRDRRNVIMYMVWANDHSIAIYQSNGMYHLFDSNFRNGRPKIINNRHMLTQELINRFFLIFGETVPDTLEIGIAQIRDPQALQYIVRTLEDKIESSSDSQPSSFSFCNIL